MAGCDEFRYSLWESADRLGWDLLGEAGSRVALCIEDELEDGTFLSVLHEHRDERRWGDGVPVRVVEDRSPDGSAQGTGAGRRLVTEPARSSAGQRRTVVSVVRRGPGGPSPPTLPVGMGCCSTRLRSKDPGLAVQEAYAHLCLARAAGSSPGGRTVAG